MQEIQLKRTNLILACDQSKKGRSINVLTIMVVPSKTTTALGLQL